MRQFVIAWYLSWLNITVWNDPLMWLPMFWHIYKRFLWRLIGCFMTCREFIGNNFSSFYQKLLQQNFGEFETHRKSALSKLRFCHFCANFRSLWQCKNKIFFRINETSNDAAKAKNGLFLQIRTKPNFTIDYSVIGMFVFVHFEEATLYLSLLKTISRFILKKISYLHHLWTNSTQFQSKSDQIQRRFHQCFLLLII